MPKQEEKVTINDLIESHSFLKRATIKLLTDFVLERTKSTCLIELIKGTENTIFLNVDKTAKEIDVLLQPLDGSNSIYTPMHEYTLNDLFNFWKVIESHSLKPYKIKPSYNAQLD